MVDPTQTEPVTGVIGATTGNGLLIVNTCTAPFMAKVHPPVPAVLATIVYVPMALTPKLILVPFADWVLVFVATPSLYNMYQ